MVHEVEVIGKVKKSDPRMHVGSRVRLDLRRRERITTLTRKTPNLPSMGRRAGELRLLLENKLTVFSNQNNDMDTVNNHFTNVVI